MPACGVLPHRYVRRFLLPPFPQVDTVASLASLPEGLRDDPSMQHSVFVIRANWTTLRRLLLALQDAVAASMEASATSASAAYLKVRGPTSGL